MPVVAGLPRHGASDSEAFARTVFHRMEVHRHHIDRLKGIGIEARRDQLRRSAQFEHPQHWLARPLVIGHDAKPGMRATVRAAKLASLKFMGVPSRQITWVTGIIPIALWCSRRGPEVA